MSEFDNLLTMREKKFVHFLKLNAKRWYLYSFNCIIALIIAGIGLFEGLINGNNYGYLIFFFWTSLSVTFLMHYLSIRRTGAILNKMENYVIELEHILRTKQ